MRIADAIPARLLPLRESLSPFPRGEEVRRLTGLTETEWEDVARRFPGLGDRPGPKAARARRILRFLVGRALATPRHQPVWRGGPPGNEPTLYLTAHLGDLRPLRYLLRRRGLPVAHILGPENLSREAIAADDLEFDRRYPVEFPHFFRADRVHGLRAALSGGSLIAVIDRVFRPGEEPGDPERRYRDAPFLGGTLQIDSAPLRLSDLARVPARPIFLTAPGGRLTVSTGAPLASERESAVAEFAALLGRTAEASPFDFDGFTHRWNPGRPARP